MRHKDRTLTEAAIALDLVNPEAIQGLLSLLVEKYGRAKDGDLTLGQIEAGINVIGRKNFDRLRGATSVTVSFVDESATVTVVSKTPAVLIHGMFVSCEDQVKNIARWNRKFDWGFSEEQIAEALAIAPTWPTYSQFTVAVLVPYLSTTAQTFEALWTIAAYQQEGRFRYDGLKSGVDQLCYLGGGHAPGLRWEVIDLAANWDQEDGIAPASVGVVASLPHAGILAAAAHFPKWVRKMDGVTVPYVWLPGYKATIPHLRAWMGVPLLNFVQMVGRVQLNAYGSAVCRNQSAVPVFRE